MAYSIADWIILALYIIAGIIGTIGNGFIIRTVFNRRMDTTTFYLIANQAFSDMSCGLFYVSLWFFCSSKMLSYGTPGLLVCELILTLKVSTFVVSSITMTAISIERYLKLYYPMNQSFSPKKAISCVWILALSISILFMFHFRSSEFFTENELIGCRVAYNVDAKFFNQHWNFLITLSAAFFIPVSITAFMYYKVIKKINGTQIVEKINDEQVEAFEESKRQTTKMLIVIVLLYCIACSPTFTIWFIHFLFVQILDEPCTSETAEPLYYRIAYLACVSSICLNPFIYCYYNQIFRSEAKRIFKNALRNMIPRMSIEENTEPSILSTKIHDCDNSSGNSSTIETTQTSSADGNSASYVNVNSI